MPWPTPMHMVQTARPALDVQLLGRRQRQAGALEDFTAGHGGSIDTTTLLIILIALLVLVIIF